jgi:hypothetical protein
MSTKTAPTNANILNALRSTMSLTYQDRIPEAVQNNINDVYQSIMKFQPGRNELVSALVKQIGLITIDSLFFNNPLTRLKKDPMRFGNTHEEIFVNMIKGTQFDNRAGIEKAFAIYESNIMAAYHRVNFDMQYPVTVSYRNLQDAFTSEYGIRDLITAKVQQCFSSANYDEYLAMKQLAESGYTKGYLYPVKVPAITDETTSKTFLASVKEYVGNIAFPNPLYNLAGATSFSSPNTLVFITTPKVNAQLGVQALAYMFNDDRAALNVETIIIDKFTNPNIQGILCDIRFFNVREQFREFTDNYNGASLNWNYFYTVVEMISASPFYPCVVFTTEDVSVKTITGTDIANYVKGSEYTLQYEVTGVADKYVPTGVDFELDGNTDDKTLIVPGTKTLIIGANETGTMSITVTSRYDTSVTGTIAVTPTAT